MSAGGLIHAPWTPEQVAGLNRWQEDRTVHPFTCGDCGATLCATADGWYCPTCEYRQRWAHDFMVLAAPADAGGEVGMASEWDLDVERQTLRDAARAVCLGCREGWRIATEPSQPQATYPVWAGHHYMPNGAWAGDCAARPILAMLAAVPDTARPALTPPAGEVGDVQAIDDLLAHCEVRASRTMEPRKGEWLRRAAALRALAAQAGAMAPVMTVSSKAAGAGGGEGPRTLIVGDVERWEAEWVADSITHEWGLTRTERERAAGIVRALAAQAREAERWRETAHAAQRERDDLHEAVREAIGAEDQMADTLTCLAMCVDYWTERVAEEGRLRLAAEAEAAALRERCERLEEALREYADRENWWQARHVSDAEWDASRGLPRPVWAWRDGREPWTMATAALDAARAAEAAPTPHHEGERCD